MPPNATSDSRLDPVETIRIPWSTYKKAVRRSYLSDQHARDSRRYRLRLTPPFEAEMKAEYHEHEQGHRYPPEMSPKPVHIRPETLLLEGTNKQVFRRHEWPTRDNTRSLIEDDGLEPTEERVDERLAEARDIYWGELKAARPSEVDLKLILAGVHESHTVELEWVDSE